MVKGAGGMERGGKDINEVTAEVFTRERGAGGGGGRGRGGRGEEDGKEVDDDRSGASTAH